MEGALPFVGRYWHALARNRDHASQVKKYLHVINIGIQNTLVYRVNFLFRAAFGLIPLMATIYLWRAVYSGKQDPSIAGYSLAGMISYYLLVTVVDALTGVTEDDWQIAADIKDGNINQFLLKPIDYMARLHGVSAMPVFLWTADLHRCGRVTRWPVRIFPAGIFRAPGQRQAFCPLPCLNVRHRSVAIFHVLHDGDAGILGFGSINIYFHPLRLRIRRRRPLVSH
jgi:hypothetical protein